LSHSLKEKESQIALCTHSKCVGRVSPCSHHSCLHWVEEQNIYEGERSQNAAIHRFSESVNENNLG